jgi:small-conductance mechanosensitive channel
MLDWIFYGNTLLAWLLAAGAATFAVVAIQLVHRVISKRLKQLASRTETDLDDVLAAALEATRGWFRLTIGLWTGSLALELAPFLRELLDKAAIFALMVQVALWGGAAIAGWVERYGTRKLEAGEGAAVTTMRAAGFLTRLAVWAIVLMVVLDTVFEIDITALVAGLGIGGLAIALALQNILSDLFASLSIVLDKPFVAGDFIIVGDLLGTVEHVGLKTTRLRALSGEQLVFSNSDLLSSRIRNFKRMFERRIVFSFGVIYQTPLETLRRIPGMVREIVESQEEVRFDRAHFQKYGASSLDFEVVYFVTVPDYNTYMDIQQAINFELFRRFEAEGIEFAYPTQTLFVTRDDPAQPTPAPSRATPAAR